MTETNPSSPKMIFTCFESTRYKLYVEPLGPELELGPGDTVTIETDAFLTGDVEVSFVTDGIVIGIYSADVVRLTDKLGQELA